MYEVQLKNLKATVFQWLSQKQDKIDKKKTTFFICLWSDIKKYEKDQMKHKNYQVT